jgi:hypothetical protein
MLGVTSVQGPGSPNWPGTLGDPRTPSLGSSWAGRDGGAAASRNRWLPVLAGTGTGTAALPAGNLAPRQDGGGVRFRAGLSNNPQNKS